MPFNPRYGQYEYTESQDRGDGSHTCVRDYGGGHKQTHQSYPNGGYGYSNPDGSMYAKGADGSSTYVSPKGQIFHNPSAGKGTKQ